MIATPMSDFQLDEIKKIIPNAERYAYKMTKHNDDNYLWNQYFHAYMFEKTIWLGRIKVSPKLSKKYS